MIKLGGEIITGIQIHVHICADINKEESDMHRGIIASSILFILFVILSVHYKG